MDNNNSRAESLRDLRKRAEVLIRTSASDVQNLSAEEIVKLVQELHTHQIELEMQNDELQRTHEELLTANEKFASLYDSAPVGYITLNENGMILEANLTIAKMFGVDRKDLIRQLFFSFVLDEDQDIYYIHRREALEKDQEQECELRMRSNGGEPFWVQIHSVSLQSPAISNQRVLQTVISDITVRHQAQEDAKTSILEWESTFAAIDDSVFLLRKGGVIRRCNAATVRLIGKPMEEIIGHQCWEIMHGSNKPMDGCPYDRMLKSKKRVVSEILQNDRCLKVTLDPVLDENMKIIGAVHQAQDITEQKQAEKENREIDLRIQRAEKLEGLVTLTGGIAHDFNNILQAIFGNLGFVMDSLPETSPHYDFLKEIQQAARRAAVLVSHMLLYVGRGVRQAESLNLSDITADAVRILKSTVSSSKVALKLQLDMSLPEIKGDSSQVKQLVTAIINNASEAIAKNKPGTVSISTGTLVCTREYLSQGVAEGALPEGLYVYFDVRDTGCGMDSKTKEKIFEPFFSTKFTGRGLGLCVVLGIVRMHNGAILVDSEPGKGTTFRVLLPVPIRESTIKAKPKEPAKQKDLRTGRTALIVDDEEPIRKLACRIIEGMGFTTLKASNGLEALDIFREHSSEMAFVLLDLTMPGMDGARTFLELQRIRHDVPVILSSGHSVNHLTEVYHAFGMAGFIHKPYEPDELTALLQKILKPSEANETPGPRLSSAALTPLNKGGQGG